MDAYSYSSSVAEITESDGEESSSGKVTDYAESFKESLNSLKERFAEMRTASSRAASKIEQDALNRIRTECINYLIRILFGRDVCGENSDYELKKVSSNDGMSSENSLTLANANNGMTVSRGMSVIKINYQAEHYFSETEDVAFSTTGKVVTADGREIDFNLELGMSRQFEEYSKISREEAAMVLCDPLVINIDAPVADVSDQKIYFDIDADGEQDLISAVGGGSGFLALDKNQDGVINDGSELFGTSSGNGFKDLAEYDKDGNGWIDEADDVFDKLKICCMDEDGKQTLYTLKEKGVGAIYLGSAATNFSLTDSFNNVNAVIRRTGMFLYENGEAGTVQHVDLAKETPA